MFKIKKNKIDALFCFFWFESIISIIIGATYHDLYKKQEGIRSSRPYAPSSNFTNFKIQTI